MSGAPVRPLYKWAELGQGTLSPTTNMAPTKQKAVIVTKDGATFGLADVPKPGPGQILVKVVAAAQNPTDCQFTRTLLRASANSHILIIREITWAGLESEPVRRYSRK
jgi:hypothetical protein